MTARHAALLAAAALSIAAARFASAADAVDGRLRVLIVIDESDDPFAERIKAEVSALGFEVVSVEPWRTGEAIESLDAAGRTNQAAAAVRMIASRKGVEVWMANQPTGRSLMRQLVVDERPVPNEGLVALQTAELLRTTLLSRSDLPPKAPPPPPSVEPPSEKPIAPPGPPTVSLQAATGPLYSPGSSITMQAWGTLSSVVVRPFGLAVDASAPLQSSTITGPEGSASLRWWLFGAAAFMRYDRPGSRLYGIAAAGGAVIRLNATATANAPLLANAGSTTAGAIYVRADGGVAATRWLRLGARAVAGVVPQGVLVQFAGNEAARWGLPFLAVFGLVDLSW